MEDSSKLDVTTEVSKMKYLSEPLVATTEVSSMEYLSGLVATTEAPLRMDDSSQLIVAITKARIEATIEATIEVSSEFLGMDWFKSYMYNKSGKTMDLGTDCSDSFYTHAHDESLHELRLSPVTTMPWIIPTTVVGKIDLDDKPLDLSRFHALAEKFDAITEESHLYGLKNDFDNKLKGLSNIKKIVSCYRAGNILSTPSDNIDLSRPVTSRSAVTLRIFDILRRFFFPLSFLSALVPKEEGKILEIEEAVFYGFIQPVASQLEYHGKHKAELIVKELKIISYDPKRSVLNCLVTKLENGIIEHKGNNIAFSLSSQSPMKDVIGCFNKLSNILCLEQIDYISPHIMFGNCGFHHQPKEIYKDLNGDHILIAVLGYGYNPNLFSKSDKKMTLPVIDSRSFIDPENAPVKNEKEGYTLPWLINEYTKTSEFIICRTTDDYGFIANNVKESPFSQSYPVKCPVDKGKGGRDEGGGGGDEGGEGGEEGGEDGGGGGVGGGRVDLEEGGGGGGGGKEGGDKGGSGGGGGDGGGDRGGGEGGQRNRFGTTAEAIRWLRENWSEQYHKKYDNLIVLIPYGGVYKEDEMIQITKATDEGIIIVCTAGDCGVDPKEVYFKMSKVSKPSWGCLIMDQPIQHNAQEMPQETDVGNVVFPAALGIGISVGVAGTGPKGREIDVSVNMYDPPVVNKEEDYEFITSNYGKAAARITSLLSLLLCRINNTLKYNQTDQDAIQVIKKLDRHHYMNTYVIRELLVKSSKSNGSHDPQLGYGDGVEIIQSLIVADDDELIEMLVDIHFKYSHNIFVQCYPYTFDDVKLEVEKKNLYNLNGSEITIAVLDCNENDQEKVLNLEPFESEPSPELHDSIVQKLCQEVQNLMHKSEPLHGDKCALIVQGVCPSATILRTDNPNISVGFNACNPTPNNVDIISCSIYLLSYQFELCKATNEAVMAGKIIVLAAGNTGQSQRNTIAYPGRIGNVIVVGGRDSYHNRAALSSVGRELDFLAEVHHVTAIGSDTCNYMYGTSFAAPVVAGYTALLLQFIKEEMAGDTVFAWSEDPNTGQYRWRDISVFKAAHNVYAMRALLKLMVSKPKASEMEGFGCLDLSELFHSYFVPGLENFAKKRVQKRIRSTLQDLYKRKT